MGLVDIPVGAPADVHELEYCSALRQTSAQVRDNASLTALDIQSHLLSRHAIHVDVAEIEQQILVELAGGAEYQLQVLKNASTHGVSRPKSSSASSTVNGRSVSSWNPLELVEETLDGNGDAGATIAEEGNGQSFKPLEAVDRSANVTIRKTTPLDLVQQTALLLVPELQKIHLDTNGTLPHLNELVKHHEDHEFEESSSEKKSTVDDPDHIDIKMMVESTLLLICEQAGIEYGVELTFSVMRDVLHAFSETHWDDETVTQMVQAACLPGESLPILDGDAFLRALTSDLGRFRSDAWSDVASTHMQDANSNKDVSDVGLPPPALTTFYSFPSIDCTADTYSNYMWTILSWFLFMLTFGSYLVDRLSNRVASGLTCNEYIFSQFGCRVIESSVVWLEVFLKLMIAGFGFMYIITLGNTEFTNRWLGFAASIVSMIFIVVVSALAFVYEVDTFFFSTSKVEAEESVYYVSFVTGIILLLLQIVQVLRMLLPNGLHSRLADIVTPSSILLEQRTKKAAEFKVCRMIRRAIWCHQQTDIDHITISRTPVNYRRLNSVCMHGQVTVALNAYHEKSFERKPIGSIPWILKSFLSRNRLGTQEGLWISPRLLWSNLTQWFVVCLTIVLYSSCYRWVLTLPDPLTPGLTHQGILSSLSIGVTTGVAAQVIIALNYVPSAISQTFQFRGGLLESLRDKNFDTYRSSQDSVDYLFGSALWGAMLTGVLVWALVAFLVLLFVWEFTRRWLVSITVQLFAFAVVVTFKNVVLLLIRRNWYAGFFRTKPGAANIMSVVLESLFLGLSTGYIATRAIMLIGLSILYVARIDTPFVADGVGLGLDKYPAAFRADILLHEAHRHPYMERWALLYLLKLRHGSKFGTKAGAAWRIVFTLALMPWLRKFRVHPVIEGSTPGGHRHGSNDSGVIPTSRINSDIQLAQQQALLLELNDLRGERELRIEAEFEIQNLRSLLSKIRNSLTADQQSFYSC